MQLEMEWQKRHLIHLLNDNANNPNLDHNNANTSFTEVTRDELKRTSAEFDRSDITRRPKASKFNTNNNIDKIIAVFN